MNFKCNLILLLICPVMLFAGPSGGEVVHGDATIATSQNNTTITQTTPKAIVHWQDFSIGERETVNFIQPSSNAAILNRVVGGDISKIYGTLTSSGKVYLVNPNGIIIGPNGTINTAQFIASTLPLSNDEFIKGSYYFDKGESKIINEGRIHADNGVYIFARDIENRGEITGSNVVIGAATELYFVEEGQEHVFIKSEALGSLDNSGIIKAANIELKAAGGNVYNIAVKQSGVISADKILEKDGRIILAAETGPIYIIDANITSKEGGDITIYGDYVTVNNTILDVSSKISDGGNITIGEDLSNNIRARQAFIDKYAFITASALNEGNGGNVIIWSNCGTIFLGNIEAKGGVVSGDGGFVEISSYTGLIPHGCVDTKAYNGKVGTLLFDPYNVTISHDDTKNETYDSNTYTPNGSPAVISARELSRQLNNNAVTIITGSSGDQNGDVTITSDIIVQNYKLTIKAAGGIYVVGGDIDLAGSKDSIALDFTANKGGIVVHRTIMGQGGILLTGTGYKRTSYELLEKECGISITNTGRISVNGNITLLGTAGCDSNGKNYGIYVNAPLEATNLTLTGVGGIAGDYNHGVYLDHNVIASRLATLTGTAGTGVNSIGISSLKIFSSDTILKGDSIAIGAEIKSASLIIYPQTKNKSIGIGDRAKGDLVISDESLLNISHNRYSLLEFGDTENTSTVNINSGNNFYDVDFVGSLINVEKDGSGLSGSGNVLFKCDNVEIESLIHGGKNQTFTIYPKTVGKSIGIGSGSGDLVINDASLIQLSGFSEWYFGDASNTNTININSTYVFHKVKFIGSEICVSSHALTSSGDVTFQCNNVNINAEVTTSDTNGYFTIYPKTSNISMGIGTHAQGDLFINDTSLANITNFSHLVFGDVLNTGTLYVNSQNNFNTFLIEFIGTAINVEDGKHGLTSSSRVKFQCDSVNIGANVSGSGGFFLYPKTSNISMGIGTQASGNLVISDTSLANIKEFPLITFGNVLNTGTLYINSQNNFQIANLHFIGTAINVENGQHGLTSSGRVIFECDSVNIGANVSGNQTFTIYPRTPFQNISIGASSAGLVIYDSALSKIISFSTCCFGDIINSNLINFQTNHTFLSDITTYSREVCVSSDLNVNHKNVVFNIGQSSNCRFTINANINADNIAVIGSGLSNTFNLNTGVVNTIVGSRHTNIYNIAGGNVANSITGGLGDDYFMFGDNKSISGKIDGGIISSNTKCLNYNSDTRNIAVNLQTGAATGVTGGISNINRVIGSGTVYGELTGKDSDSTWIINAERSGSIASGNPLTTYCNFDHIDTLHGGLCKNIFNVNAGGSVKTITGGNLENTYNIHGGDVTGGITGGSGNDTFVFTDKCAIKGKINGGIISEETTPTKRLNYSSYTSRIFVNLNNESATGVYAETAGGISNINEVCGSKIVYGILTGRTGQNYWKVTGTYSGTVASQNSPDKPYCTFENISRTVGSALGDTFNVNSEGIIDVITGNGDASVTNYYHLYAGGDVTQQITGGNGNDYFIFHEGAMISGKIDGGAQGTIKCLDYNIYNDNIYVDLGNKIASGVNSGEQDGITNITQIGGSIGDFSNVIIGDNVVNTWNITGANSVNILTSGNVYCSCENVSVLIGSIYGDTFHISSLGIIDTLVGSGDSTVTNTYIIDGGDVQSEIRCNGGNNHFIFYDGCDISGKIVGCETGTQWLDYSLYVDSVLVNLPEKIATGVYGGLSEGVTNINKITAGQNDNVLIASDTQNTSFVFYDIPNTISVVLGNSDFSDTLTIEVGGNLWTITNNDCGYVSKADGLIVFSNVKNLTSGWNNDTFWLRGCYISGLITGRGIGNTLIGENVDNQLWLIKQINAGSVGKTNFVNMQNIIGGNLNDRFVIYPNAGISGTLDGDGGSDNILDFSLWTRPVYVDLAHHEATNIGYVTNIQTIIWPYVTTSAVYDATWLSYPHSDFLIDKLLMQKDSLTYRNRLEQSRQVTMPVATLKTQIVNNAFLYQPQKDVQSVTKSNSILSKAIIAFVLIAFCGMIILLFSMKKK